MSDIVTLTSTEQAPARPRRRGLQVLVVVVVAVAVVAGLLLAADLRSRAARDDAQRSAHGALVAASTVWDPLWTELDKAPGDRDLDSIAAAASVGGSATSSTFVSTRVVANDPTVLSAIVTVQSEGITTYTTQVVRRNEAWGIAGDSMMMSCDAGTMMDGTPCLDWIEAQARQWSTSTTG